MAEKITFHFEGALASDNSMNFYEASRFQYAAARLMVKLAQFRRDGTFVKNITSSSNFNILLQAQSRGSFNINTESPEVSGEDKKFVDLTISDLLAYISERLIEKGDDDGVRSSLNANAALLGTQGFDANTKEETIEEMLRLIAQDEKLRRKLHPETRELIERRIAEIDRETRLEAGRKEIAKIDAAREQKLISMSAPLVSEMATALRKSATSLEIVGTNAKGPSTIVYLNRRMASEIETSKVDREITPIYGNIIQYNKENGWGKLRIQGETGVYSFSIPSDLKVGLQPTLISQMRKDLVYLQAYFVRDKAEQVTRLIIVGVLPIRDE
ncbi:MAG TPA: hypothetical protein VGU01_11235 [Sphingomicrobium sp.]|nr:hypothetical protein [Sphingomicrobium sp.]